MINFGNISIADLRLGATQVKAAYLGNKQVWSLGPVVPKYDIQSIGRSIFQQGTSIKITEQAGETITLYIKTNATDLTNKQVCAAVYLNSTDVTPYASFAFSNVSLTGRYITGTTPDVGTWVPSGFPETYSTLYMKTWIQDTGYIDPADALGEVLDWTGEEPPPVSLLCFTSEQANSTLHLDKVGSPNAISLETSTDGTTWTDYSWSGNTGDTLTLANVGDKVYMRAKTENQTIGSSDSNHYKFIMSGKIAASGNIQTLLKADGSRTDAPAYCYLNIFRNCSSLTTASITLPALTLNNACYQDMFGSCSSLTTGPAVLPAATLVNNCYGGMFHRCSSLTAAPKLSAPTLVYNSCPNMFLYCSALSSIEVAFTAWISGATSNWMEGVAASGTFTCPAALPDRRGSYNIPSGWTKVDAA